MASSIGTYATLADAKLRLGITDTVDDTLLQDFCSEINQLIETECGRVVGPRPTFTGALGAAAAAGATTVDVEPTTSGLFVGDVLALGPVTGTHESAQVVSITGNSVRLATALGSAYASNAPAERVYVYDGFTALENGKVLPVPEGVQYLTALEVSTFTVPAGGAIGTNVIWYLLPATDYFTLPHNQSRVGTFWPATEITITNVPQPGDSTPSFFPGFNNVRLWGALGFAAVPDDVVRIALNVVVSAYRERGTGGGNVTTIDSGGVTTIQKYMSASDWRTLAKYRAVSRDAFIL